MMASYSPIIQFSLTLDTINWTPLVMPQGVNSVYMLNPTGSPGDVKRRTIAGDPTTEITIRVGLAEAFFLPKPSDGTGPRFPAGLTTAFYQAVAGAPTLNVIGVP